VVLLEDECHLLWGDACGYVWGRRNQRLEVSMLNERQRQTYYGAVNLLTHEIHLRDFPAGNGQYTVAYLRWLRDRYPDQKIILLWDGATYHRDQYVKAFLAQQNDGKPELDWTFLCLALAPNAPQQNPVEAIWLQAKNHLRKHFAQNKTFVAVKNCFVHFLRHFRLESIKFAWYMPNP
jgi:transposase